MEKIKIEEWEVFKNLWEVLFLDPKTFEKKLADFEVFVSLKIGRDLKPLEKVKLYLYIQQFIRSEPMTKTRIDIMSAITNLAFIENHSDNLQVIKI